MSFSCTGEDFPSMMELVLALNSAAETRRRLPLELAQTSSSVLSYENNISPAALSETAFDALQRVEGISTSNTDVNILGSVSIMMS